MPNKLGRALINFYYKHSPFMANLIAKHKALKTAVRISLLPIVAISYSILHFSPKITAAVLFFIFVLFIFSVWQHRRNLNLIGEEQKK